MSSPVTLEGRTQTAREEVLTLIEQVALEGPRIGRSSTEIASELLANSEVTRRLSEAALWDLMQVAAGGDLTDVPERPEGGFVFPPPDSKASTIDALKALLTDPWAGRT